MKQVVDELLRHYQRHPREWRIVATILAGTALVWQGEQLGETLGKALYYLTH